MSTVEESEVSVISILTKQVARQHASVYVERLIQTADAMRKHGLVAVAQQLESAYFDIYETNGIDIVVPVVMELRNAQTDTQIWQYSDVSGFASEGLAIPGISTPISAEHRAQVIALNSIRYENRG